CLPRSRRSRPPRSSPRSSPRSGRQLPRKSPSPSLSRYRFRRRRRHLATSLNYSATSIRRRRPARRRCFHDRLFPAADPPAGGAPRVIPVTVTAGAEVSQYLELPETPSLGSLLVQSDTAGARVSVDGADHGRAPVSVADLTPGEHEVVLQADSGPAVRQRVVI